MGMLNSPGRSREAKSPGRSGGSSIGRLKGSEQGCQILIRKTNRTCRSKEKPTGVGGEQDSRIQGGELGW